MAVSVFYDLSLEREMNAAGTTAVTDATSLAGGGVAVVGDHLSHSDTTFFAPDGALDGAPDGLPFALRAAIAQLDNGNTVIAADRLGQAYFTIVHVSGATLVPRAVSGGTFTDLSGIDVAGLADGGFAVACHVVDGAENNLRINIHDSAGNAVTSFTVDATEANDQAPSIAALADGGFAVAWHRFVGPSAEVWYAVYEADGTVRQAPVLLDDQGTNLNPSVVALADGGFAIAYEDNSWSAGTDMDITLARFDAAGTFVDQDDVSQNDDGDGSPSTTLLSNGLLLVGSTRTGSGFVDPSWTLVDPETGAVLVTRDHGATSLNDHSTTVAGMLDGGMAVFFNSENEDVVGYMLQTVRISNGDSANDFIVGDELVDIVMGGGGDDVIAGRGGADSLAGSSGNDTFVYATGDEGGDTIDGGQDFDRILLLANADLRVASIAAMEKIEFTGQGVFVAPIVATIGASQVGAGLAANLVVDGDPDTVANTLRITMGTAVAVDLSGFTFVDFDTSSTGNDRLQVDGDADAETMVGSVLDDALLSGGGNDTVDGGTGRDTLTGGAGDDLLRGGAGNDMYMVDAAGEAVEAAGEGRDVVKSLATYTLGANLEDLVLLGVGNLGGTGNALNNKLTGNSAKNALDGGLGNDVLVGGRGTDTLTGGDGNDRFDFLLTADSKSGKSDTITDFAGNGALAGDVIDLSAIDANPLVAGNQSFTFIGSAPFTGAGQVRYINGVLLATADGDRYGEMRIALAGNPSVVADDLIL